MKCENTVFVYLFLCRRQNWSTSPSTELFAHSLSLFEETHGPSGMHSPPIRYRDPVNQEAIFHVSPLGKAPHQAGIQVEKKGYIKMSLASASNELFGAAIS